MKILPIALGGVALTSLYWTVTGQPAAPSAPTTPLLPPATPPTTTPQGGGPTSHNNPSGSFTTTAPNPNGNGGAQNGGQGSGNALVPAGGTRTNLNIMALSTQLPTVPLAPGTIFSTSDGLIEREPLDGSQDQQVIADYRKYAAQNPIPPMPGPTTEGVVDPVNAETARRFANDALQSGYPATALALTKLAAAKDAISKSMNLAVPAPIVQPLSQTAIQAVSDANQVLFGVVTMPTTNIQALITALQGFNLLGIANLLTAFIRTNAAPSVPAAVRANAIAVTAGMPSGFAAGVQSALTNPNASRAAVQQLLTQLQASFPNQFPTAVNALKQLIANKRLVPVQR